MEATVVKERPILFSGPMVRAILDGRKTMTRRVLNPQPPFYGDTAKPSPTVPGAWDFASNDPEKRRASLRNFPTKNRYGQPGERLWVRETFYIDDIHYVDGPVADAGSEINREQLYFHADGGCCQQIPECQCAEVGKPKWRPSIHMPRWASRITLEITSVRVERLQGINWSDAIAEGIKDPRRAYLRVDRERGPVGQFRELWDSINGERPNCDWKSNPWVWVVSFKRLA